MAKQKSRGGEKDSSDEHSNVNLSSKQKSSRSERPLEEGSSPFDRDLLARLPDGWKEVTKSGRPVRRVNLTEKFVKVKVIVFDKEVKDKSNVCNSMPCIVPLLV